MIFLPTGALQPPAQEGEGQKDKLTQSGRAQREPGEGSSPACWGSEEHKNCQRRAQGVLAELRPGLLWLILSPQSLLGPLPFSAIPHSVQSM